MRDADLFAARAWTACAAVGGALIGLLKAPHVQLNLSYFGVDPFDAGPALVVIGAFAVAAGVRAWFGVSKRIVHRR